MKTTPGEGINWITRPKTSVLLADKLKQDLQSGTWTGELPGIRPLMKHYGLSAPSVREALGLLEQEGWISPAGKGINRGIIRKRRRSGPTEILLGRPEIGEMTWLTHIIYRAMTDAFNKMKIPIREIALQGCRQLNFAKKLHESVTMGNGVFGVIGLDVNHDTLRKGIGTDLPLLVVGAMTHDDPRCASVAVRLREILPKAIHYLAAKKIPEFSIISAGLRKPFYERLFPFIRDAYEANGRTFDPDIHFPWIGPGCLSPSLKIMTRDGKPRLLVTINEAMWSRVLWEVRRMSHVVDVTAMWPSSAFMAFENPPCLCQIQTREFTRHILKWHAEVKLGRIPTFSHGVGVKAIWGK